MWTDLSQEDKYNLIKDYVRRGFDSLDDIMNDYDSSMPESELRRLAPESLVNTAGNDPLQDVINEWYASTEWPTATRQDFDY